MANKLNHGAICGRVFAAMPTLTPQQEAVLLDHLDGLTESDLRQYAANAGTLAKSPLNPHDERALAGLSQRLTGLPGVMNFTAANVASLTADIKHLIETDC